MIKKAICALALVLAFITPFAQVNLQTGSAVFSLPMFSWQDNKSRLYAPVALSYNSGNGLKVNEVASNVGQGWNLIAGGVVTRMQVGEPDDQVAREANVNGEKDVTKYPAGYLTNTVAAYNGCPEALTKYPTYESRNQVYTQHNVIAEDKQLDYFSFQFNGKAGMFVLDKLNGDVGASLGDTKMKITFKRDNNLLNQGFRTNIASFTIQDVDGLTYRFATYGYTKVLQNNYCDADLTAKQTQPKFKSDKVYHQTSYDVGPSSSPYVNTEMANPYIIGSWYLTDITDSLAGRKIQFGYGFHDLSLMAGEDISYNKSGNYTIISHKKSVARVYDISIITYPDGHTVTFNYGKDRSDLAGEKALANVNIAYLGRTLSQYNLNTTYFVLNRYGTPASPYQKKMARLCLRSVQKIGVDLKEDTPPYSFDYYTGSNAPYDVVPPPFAYAKDIWGYYNANNNIQFGTTTPIIPNNDINTLNNTQLMGLCYIDNSYGLVLNPKSGSAKNGLLKQIIYPTGGTLLYQYDQNAGTLYHFDQGSGTLLSDNIQHQVGGVHVSQTSSTDGGFSNGCGNPVITQYAYVLDQSTNSSLWGMENPVNNMDAENFYSPEKKYFKWGTNCLFGCCDYRYKYPGILSRQQGMDLTGFQQLMETLGPILGIISVVSTINDVISVLSVGAPPLAVVAVVIDIITNVFTLIFTCTVDNSKHTVTKIYYNADLNGISPLPAQFKRVEVIENPGTIGKTVHEFTSMDDYDIWEPSNLALSSKQRFAPWAYGLPKLVSVFDATGKKVKETQNDYNFTTFGHTLIEGKPLKSMPNPSGKNSDLVSCKCLVEINHSQRYPDWSDPAQFSVSSSYHTSSYSDMLVDFNGYYTGRTLLTRTYERTYKQGDETKLVEKITNFNYDADYATLTHISSTESNGDNADQYFTYTYGSSGGVYDILKKNNILFLPVSRSTTVYKGGYNGPNSGNIKDEFTSYIQLPTGDIKPSQVLEKRYAYPGATPSQAITQSYTYDVSGNLAGVKDESNRTISNIYDYDDKYIVASVINADNVLDKPAYSSFETTGFGGWSLSGTATYVTGPSITGVRSFNLTSNTLTASLNSSKAYKISFWATNSNVVVSGATLITSTPVINGFTYYEYNIVQGATSVSVSGSSTIDELRLYPKMARMRTVTYDPLIGKTAECDENNRITYYEYDNLGRLRFIKDEKKNIVKMYEYNNVSAAKQNGCPISYANYAISETFTKSNCGTGYLGDTRTSTVPAGKYTSAVSQADADAKAENELFQMGQADADANGTCILLYYNDAQSETDVTESCGPGGTGGQVTYSVPANKYWSTISKADANQKALDEVAANAQANANAPGHSCTVSTTPFWEWDNQSSNCQNVNGNLPAHEFVLETDVNPNSSTYLQTRWSDIGPQDACPAGNYYNASQSQPYTKNNCPSGLVGSSVTYTIPPGKYSSTVSLAAANQLATNDMTANGQNYANTNGTCTSNCTINMAYGYNKQAGSFASNGTTVSYYIVFTTMNGMSLGSTYKIGTITGGCLPSGNRTQILTEGGRTWNVTIYADGSFYMQLQSVQSGSTAPPAGSTFGLSGGSYNL